MHTNEYVYTLKQISIRSHKNKYTQSWFLFNFPNLLLCQHSAGKRTQQLVCRQHFWRVAYCTALASAVCFSHTYTHAVISLKSNSWQRGSEIIITSISANRLQRNFMPVSALGAAGWRCNSYPTSMLSLLLLLGTNFSFLAHNYYLLKIFF